MIIKDMKIFKVLLTKLAGFSKTVMDFLLPVLTSEIQKSLARVLPQALNVVKDLAQNNELTGAEKRQRAVDTLTQYIKLEGQTVSTSVLNLAIELAVVRIKNSQATES